MNLRPSHFAIYSRAVAQLSRILKSEDFWIKLKTGSEKRKVRFYTWGETLIEFDRHTDIFTVIDIEFRAEIPKSVFEDLQNYF